MTHHYLRDSLLAAAAAVCLLPAVAAGQGAAQDAAAAAKKPNAALKPTPHMADGHPDLNGVWHHFFQQGSYTPAKPGVSLAFGSGGGGGGRGGGGRGAGAAPAPPSKPEYKAEYVAKVADLDKRQNETDATLRCGPPGVPRIGPPQQILQTPGQVVFLYTDLTGEYFRIIPTDGSAHRTDQEASFNGDSIGRWEGDTLVVDANNFVDDSWLGDDGLFHSDKLHVIERLQRKGDTLRYDVTVEDPVVLAKPWNMDPRILTLQDDALEQAPPCMDRDESHLTDLSHHGNAR